MHNSTHIDSSRNHPPLWNAQLSQQIITFEMIILLVTFIVTSTTMSLAQLSCPVIGMSGAYTYDSTKPNGPSNWGIISPVCGTGTSQSPIDIPLPKPPSVGGGPMPNLNIATMTLKKSTENWALECKLAGTCGSTKFNGITYNVINLHFHAPAEHKLGGNSYPLEAHIVHQDPVTKALLVIAVLFDDLGSPSLFLGPILTQICVGSNTIAVLLSLILTNNNGFCSYNGSLTTPPCSEGVTFIIANKIQSVTLGQVADYRQTSGALPLYGNNRPVQNLNGRMITCY